MNYQLRSHWESAKERERMWFSMYECRMASCMPKDWTNTSWQNKKTVSQLVYARWAMIHRHDLLQKSLFSGWITHAKLPTTVQDRSSKRGISLLDSRTIYFFNSDEQNSTEKLFFILLHSFLHAEWQMVMSVQSLRIKPDNAFPKFVVLRAVPDIALELAQTHHWKKVF